MDDQHADATAVHRALPWTVAFAAVCALLALFVGVGPAGAATENAQLSLTGPVDGNNPTGGSQLGVRPGTTINFSASAAPTQKVKDLASSIGLGNILGSVLGTTDFQVVANFAGLPGGHSNTTLTGSSKASFHFSRVGTYSFSYQAQQVSVGLLGKKIVPINLDGNQAKKAHVALNASNQYVGRIVVSNSPKNGISIQPPSVQVHPKVGNIQLPNIKIPGIQAPTLHTSVPNLNKPKTLTKKAGSSKLATTNSGSGGTLASGTDGLLPVPSRVVPGGYGSTSSGGGGGGGFYGSTNSGSSGSGYASLQLSNPDGSKTTLGGSPAADSSQPAANADSATSKSSPAAQLPVVLAIVAIIALALVASTYARLFLVRRAT